MTVNALGFRWLGDSSPPFENDRVSVKMDPRMARALPLAVTVAIILFLALYVVYQVKLPPPPVRRGEGSTKANMYALNQAVEDFSGLAGGYYPAGINTTVMEVLEQLGESSSDSSSIAGGDGIDSVRARDIGSTGPALLPRGFSNVYDPCYRSDSVQLEFDRSDRARPALVTSLMDPPAWKSESAGMVFYVPLGVHGKVATGYKIYGVDRRGLKSLVLSSRK